MNVRGLVRSKMRAVFEAHFNDALAELSPQYGFEAFEIDWGPGSRNFIQSQLPSVDDADGSGIEQYPAVVLYTSSVIDEHSGLGKFGGQVLAHMHFILEYRTLRAEKSPGAGESEETIVYDTESAVDAVTEAILATLQRGRVAHLLDLNAMHSDTRIDAGPVKRFGDGYRQGVMLTAGFDAKIR